MELKYIKTMVSERKKIRGLKYTPTYDYHKHWKSTSGQSMSYLLFTLTGESIKHKPLTIGGIKINY